ncbi:uncharacterized protein LOC121677231 [Arvicola amphibius]|uniref:uncharacterized protein LOC121677231 n=1 Tax=Arvicola amphibius TaxID=1047088 RepID=UPI001C0A23B9|nr:uncharacterized protein LOC121677231 [Arvicola amphibius]
MIHHHGLSLLSLPNPHFLRLLPPYPLHSSPLQQDPPPYREQALPPQVADSTDENEGPAAPSPAAPSPMAARLRGRRDQQLAADSTSSQAFPLRTGGNGQLQYWPFSSSDLYNWKNNNPSFSEDPVRLTALIESVLITHQPTWDDCQQLLQTLLTSEEKQRVLLEARKAVRGTDGRPTQLPNEIDAAFPLERPNWDFTTQEGRNHLILYRQLLIAGLHGAGRRPTNLAKVKQVLQGPGETPSAFLERLKEAYRRYTPYDPEDPGQETSVAMSFIWQSAPDIKRRLERLENLREDRLRKEFPVKDRVDRRETGGGPRWGEDQQKAYQEIKRALLTAPALGLPDLTKPFELFVDEKQGYTKGVLTQKLGPWRRPVAYLSKKLDPVASGWPPCLRMVAAIAVLTKDAGKLTLGQPLAILAPHAMEALVKQPPDRWLSNARMTHYQAMLLDTDRVHFGPVVTLNPATLLPLPEGGAKHNCLNPAPFAGGRGETQLPRDPCGNARDQTGPDGSTPPER